MQYLLALCGTLALPACAAKYAEVPARLDLAPYGRIALVTFSADQADTALSTFATQRFAEELLGSQSGIELLELGSADSSISQLGDRDVPAVFIGTLKVSSIKPSGSLGGLTSLRVRASVNADLTVRLVSTRTGGTVWRSSSAAKGSLGHLGLSGSRPSVSMRDRQEAYGELVNALVADVTRDFKSTWVKQ